MQRIRHIVILLTALLLSGWNWTYAQDFREPRTGYTGNTAANLFPPTEALSSPEFSGSPVSRKLSPRESSSSSDVSGSSPKKPGSAGSIATTLGGLTIVLLLIGGGAFLLRKHVPLATGILPPEVVQVLGRRFLDQRQCLQLIRIGNRILVLSHSPQHGLRTLSEITDPVEVDMLAGMCRPSEPGSVTGQFASFLWKSHAAHDEYATDAQQAPLQVDSGNYPDIHGESGRDMLQGKRPA